MHWYLDVLRKYAVFSGRARRQEYWMFALFNCLIGIVFQVLFLVSAHSSSGSAKGSGLLLISGICFLYTLALFIPSLSVSVRRLHDADRSGWWLLIGLVPLVGGIVLFVLFVLDGTPGGNRFGPDPKGRQVAVVV